MSMCNERCCCNPVQSVIPQSNAFLFYTNITPVRDKMNGIGRRVGHAQSGSASGKPGLGTLSLPNFPPSYSCPFTPQTLLHILSRLASHPHRHYHAAACPAHHALRLLRSPPPRYHRLHKYPRLYNHPLSLVSTLARPPPMATNSSPHAHALWSPPQATRTRMARQRQARTFR